MQLKEGAAIVAAAEKTIEETKAKLVLAEGKKTNRDSMVDDVWSKYPKIKDEVRGWRRGVGGDRGREARGARGAAFQ